MILWFCVRARSQQGCSCFNGARGVQACPGMAMPVPCLSQHPAPSSHPPSTLTGTAVPNCPATWFTLPGLVQWSKLGGYHFSSRRGRENTRTSAHPCSAAFLHLCSCQMNSTNLTSHASPTRAAHWCETHCMASHGGSITHPNSQGDLLFRPHLLGKESDWYVQQQKLSKNSLLKRNAQKHKGFCCKILLFIKG